MLFVSSFFLCLISCSLLSSVSSQSALSGPFSGSFTYYGAGGGNAGACSLGTQTGDSNTLTSSSPLTPWMTSLTTTVAINAGQWAASAACGQCIMYRGTNPTCTTCGANPVSSNWQYAIVADLCPGCGAGGLDLALTGDGSWAGEWAFVECNVASTPFVYALQGSNPYYMKLQIANTRYGVSSVSLADSTSTLITLTLTSDNFWTGAPSASGTFVFPASIHVTSSIGGTVVDTVPGSLNAILLSSTGNSNGNVPGAAQFPEKGYAVAGTASASGSAASSSPSPSPASSSSSKTSPASNSASSSTTSSPASSSSLTTSPPAASSSSPSPSGSSGSSFRLLPNLFMRALTIILLSVVACIFNH